MTDPGEPSKIQSRKRRRIDYTAIVNQDTPSRQESDSLFQIRRHMSLWIHMHVCKLKFDQQSNNGYEL